MRYSVMYNQDAKTLTIGDEGADSTSSAKKGTSKSVGTLVYSEFGEVPTAESHPQPHQHLENIARQLAIDTREITVKNDTDNKRLDQFEREGIAPDRLSNADRDEDDDDLDRDSNLDSKTGDENVQANALIAAQAAPDKMIRGSDTDGLDAKIDPKAAGELAERNAKAAGSNDADAKAAGTNETAARQNTNRATTDDKPLTAAQKKAADSKTA